MGVATIMSLVVIASKSLSSANITAHTVSSVARSAATMVKIFFPSQKWDLCVVVAVLVSKVIVSRPTPENSDAVLERQLSDESYACALNSNGRYGEILRK